MKAVDFLLAALYAVAVGMLTAYNAQRRLRQK